MGGGALLPLIIAEGAASVKTDLDRFEEQERGSGYFSVGHPVERPGGTGVLASVL